MMKKKQKFLNQSLAMSCAVFAVCLSIGVGAIGFYTYYQGMIDKYQAYIEGIINMAMTEIDADDMQVCVDSLTKTQKYNMTQECINTLMDNFDIEYIYIIKPLNFDDIDNMMYILTGLDEAERQLGEGNVSLGALSGKEYNTEVVTQYMEVMNSECDDIIYYVNETEFGHMYTGLVPIRDSYGNSVAVLSVDISMKEVASTVKSYLKYVVIGSILLTVLFQIVLYKWMRRRVIAPVEALELSAKKFVSDSHDITEPDKLKFEKPQINTNDEIELLCDALYMMSEDMKSYMTNLLKETQDKERIASELNVATQIQTDMLPSIFPAYPDRKEFDIYATMMPAKEVGGDFYDYFLIDDNHLGMVIADVSGKGVPAALFMVIAKTLIKNRALMGGSPKEILAFVNNQLCENNKSAMFVTVWLGIMEISTGKVVAANAGHEYPAIRTAQGDFELMKDKHGFVLAGMEDMTYTDYEFTLEKGGCLYLYTDGVAEASNIHEELFTMDRMIVALNKDSKASLDVLLKNVRMDIDKFVGEAPQFDDITMFALVYYGTEE